MPKGPLAPAQSASELRQSRQRSWLITLSALLALVPVFIIVLGYYSPANKENAVLEDDLSETDVVVEESPIFEPEEAMATEIVKQSVWRRARLALYAWLSKKEDNEAGTDFASLPPPPPPLPLAPPAPEPTPSDSVRKKSMAPVVKTEIAMTPRAVFERGYPELSEPTQERDSVLIRGFKADLGKPGVKVRGDLYLFSTTKGLRARYQRHANALEVAVQNIFYITEPENLKIPTLENLILQKVSFVFPLGVVTRVELRNLQTEWDNR